MYSYANGDLLRSRNTYYYSKYGGVGFLRAWREQRKNILDKLPKASEVDIRFEVSGILEIDEEIKEGNGVCALDLLGSVYKSFVACSEGKEYVAAKKYVDIIVNRFEVTKRIHEEYNSDLKPVDKKAYSNMNLYILAATLFEFVYRKTGDIKYLNVLLKILDTLCAYNKKLLDLKRSELAWLLKNELNHVMSLAIRCGVSI